MAGAQQELSDRFADCSGSPLSASVKIVVRKTAERCFTQRRAQSLTFAFAEIFVSIVIDPATSARSSSVKRGVLSTFLMKSSYFLASMVGSSLKRS